MSLNNSTKTIKKCGLKIGVTAPLKNVRKRRFRKTLKKKYAEGPEVEKEVKRLLTIDNDSANVKWEVLNEEDLLPRIKTEVIVKKENEQEIDDEMYMEHEYSNDGNSTMQMQMSASHNAEHDIFGGPVSDSDDEENKVIDI